MTIAANSFKTALKTGRQQVGLWLAMADTNSAEICATAGFDWLLIDAEHAPNDLKSIVAQARAISAYPSSQLVRLPVADAVLIKQVLELGVQTIVVPMVETADVARTVARAMRYTPAGSRGVGSGIARSSRWGAWPTYLREADEQMCCIVQLESTAALDQLEEIATVEGVDAIFVGAADLAADMGLLGQPNHPDVAAAVANALARAKQLNKPCGFLATEPSTARQLLDAGAAFVAVGVDTTLLARAARSLAKDFGLG